MNTSLEYQFERFIEYCRLFMLARFRLRIILSVSYLWRKKITRSVYKYNFHDLLRLSANEFVFRSLIKSEESIAIVFISSCPENPSHAQKTYQKFQQIYQRDINTHSRLYAIRSHSIYDTDSDCFIRMLFILWILHNVVYTSHLFSNR